MGRAQSVLQHGLVALALTGLLGDAPVTAQPARSAAPDARISIVARPITSFDPRDPGKRRFGPLEFRGGLELSSEAKEFGGISAIRMDKDGAQFVAATDRGWWLRGRIVYAGVQPKGVADAELAPMLGPDGRPLRLRGWFDVESLAEDGGIFYAGVERANQILRFDVGRYGLQARGVPIPVPPGVKQLPFNKGLEGLVFVAKGPLAGTLIGLSERGLDSAGNILCFLIGGPRPGTFTVRRTGDYDLTDGALLPGGDLLVLERRFSLFRGGGVRIRRIAASTVAPGALVDGPILLEADLGYQIDNMEGLSVHQADDGELILTLVSDDNFSPIQRTLLLQFTLLEP